MAPTPFNRERFLFFLFAGLLTYQGTIFAFGMVHCFQDGSIKQVCPEIGERWDSFTENTTAAVLGLIAGSAAVAASQAQSKRKEQESHEERVAKRQAEIELNPPDLPRKP